MENIAYTEARDLLERILTQTDPANNTATILLVHKSEIAQDSNPMFVYESKATVDLLLSDRLEDKRLAVQKIGWNLSLKDKNIDWTYQKPYDVLLIPAYRSNLR